MMPTIKITQRHRESVVKWLHDTVDPNVRYSEQDLRLSPSYVSTTAQIAVWKSQNGLWEVEQRGRWHYIEVTVDDERVLLEIALKYS
jgi:hypothetical protein